MTPISKAWHWQREQMAEGGQYASTIAMRGLGTMLLIDVVVPVGTYYVARGFGASVTVALLIATVASAIRNVQVMVKQREVDGFAAFMFVVLAVGLVASLWTGDPRFMLLKGAIGGLLAGVAFSASSLIKRPLSFEIAKRLAGDDHARGDLRRGWSESKAFRRGMHLMTQAWGLGLIADGVISMAMIYTLPIDTSVWAMTVLKVITFTALGAWNVWFVEFSRKLAREMGRRRHLSAIAAR
ncbi:VC0807 family protein [Calidifontibacter terrae]